MNKKLNIIIFGDSIVSCSQLIKNKRWSYILKKKFEKKVNNISTKFKICSFNGATTKEAVNKIKFVLDTRKIDILILMFGINDSVYWISGLGKPRVDIKDFKKNIIKLIKKAKKKCDPKIIFLTSHKFLQNRLEGNGKTHNHNYQNYRKEIFKISKSHKFEVIDIYKELNQYSPKNYCLALPDGLHLSNFGSLKYSEIVSKFIINGIIKKK